MRTRAILDFCAWIEQTSLSVYVQSTPVVVPAVQTVHILAFAAVLASALMIDLRLLGVTGRELPLARVTARFRPVIWWSLPILLLTGMIMISGEPARSLANSVFQLKMLFLIGAIIVTLGLQAPLKANPGYWEASGARRGAAKVVAIVSMLLWIGIVCAGRWIAYT
jgi:hypothetical protein